MRKKSPRVQQLIDAGTEVFWDKRGLVKNTREFRIALEQRLGPLYALFGKEVAEILDEWSDAKAREFLRHDWRIRWDNKSERVVIHSGDGFIHKRIRARYLETLGKEGIEEARRLIQGFIQAIEPSIQANTTIVTGYIAALEQLDATNAQQLNLFSNPEAEEHAQ